MKKQEQKKQFLANKKKKVKGKTNKNKTTTLIYLRTDQNQVYKQIYMHIPRVNL